MLWARNGCRWTDDRITLLVEWRAIGAFGRAHDDERSDGRERGALFWKLKDEPRSIVLVRLDCF